MKIAFFNIQNLFHRDRSLLQKSFGKCMSDWVNELDRLMHCDNLNDSYERIRELTFLLGFDKTLQQPYAVLRRKAGYLYLKGKDYSKELCANELTDWNGWVSLRTVPIDSIATQNKAKVIADADADVLVLHEIEDHASLEEFNASILPEYGCEQYDEICVMQGQEKRGLEKAILLKNGYRLDAVKSHKLTSHPDSPKDILEYQIKTPSGESLIILSTQFQETIGNNEQLDIIRKNQAMEVAEIYRHLSSSECKKVVVTGTLNDVSYSDCLSPLLRDTDLKDITKHELFNVDIDKGSDASYFRLGAYRLGVNIKQKDYMLLSPELFSTIKNCGLNRKGMWPEKRPQWSVYKSVGNKIQAASGCPLVWGEVQFR